MKESKMESERRSATYVTYTLEKDYRKGISVPVEPLAESFKDSTLEGSVRSKIDFWENAGKETINDNLNRTKIVNVRAHEFRSTLMRYEYAEFYSGHRNGTCQYTSSEEALYGTSFVAESADPNKRTASSSSGVTSASSPRCECAQNMQDIENLSSNHSETSKENAEKINEIKMNSSGTESEDTGDESLENSEIENELNPQQEMEDITESHVDIFNIAKEYFTDLNENITDLIYSVEDLRDLVRQIFDTDPVITSNQSMWQRFHQSVMNYDKEILMTCLVVCTIAEVFSYFQ